MSSSRISTEGAFSSCAFFIIPANDSLCDTSSLRSLPAPGSGTCTAGKTLWVIPADVIMSEVVQYLKRDWGVVKIIISKGHSCFVQNADHYNSVLLL